MVANEVLLERTGLRVGDRVVMTFWGDEELGLFGADGTVLHGPQVEVEIVGVGRGLTDLTAVEEDFAKAEASGLHFSQALAERDRRCRWASPACSSRPSTTTPRPRPPPSRRRSPTDR